MANMLHVQIYPDLIRRRERVFRDRKHWDVYDDVDFRSRYRLRRATVMNIIDGLRDDIQLGHVWKESGSYPYSQVSALHSTQAVSRQYLEICMV